MMSSILFYFFSGLAMLAAAFIVITKNVLYAACALVITLLSIAGLYILNGAEFVGITQLMIYVGGIVVLMIFGIMLTNKIAGKALLTESHNLMVGFLAGFGVFAVLFYAIIQINLPVIQQLAGGELNNINQIGVGVMSDFVLPFEIAAILLLIALIGAATLAGKRSIKKEKT